MLWCLEQVFVNWPTNVFFSVVDPHKARAQHAGDSSGLFLKAVDSLRLLFPVLSLTWYTCLIHTHTCSWKHCRGYLCHTQSRDPDDPDVFRFWCEFSSILSASKMCCKSRKIIIILKKTLVSKHLHVPWTTPAPAPNEPLPPICM